MTRAEFEQTYLDKEVTIRFFDGDTLKGVLKKAKREKNYYTIDGYFVFRKSHITKIKLD